MALRPAPVQVNFLGYVGTQAGDWIDYIIADATVLPPEQEIHFAEQPVRLPFSCYPSDRFRPTPAPDTDRAAHGLPTQGTVFACFNNPFKIAPAVFGAWLDILRRAEGSVLWLYEGNPMVGANLRAAAKQAGIDPARLIFAQPATLEAHIARHGCADLFLDTMPYGAHTTALDALWAGLPLLTCAGESWASRVGASLLRAVGLPQLITTNLPAYTELALTLTADPVFLQSLRTHLVQARQTSPLFDAAAFARALEDGYRQMAAKA
jgi:predicted O-linked N-acetylglucosamine transferase (SPINDLY family)